MRQQYAERLRCGLKRRKLSRGSQPLELPGLTLDPYHAQLFRNMFVRFNGPIEEFLLVFVQVALEEMTEEDVSRDASAIDFVRYRQKYKKSIRRLRDEEKLEAKDKALLAELDETLTSWYTQHQSSWTEVAKAIFGFKTNSEIKVFLNWRYALQRHGLLERCSKK